MCRGEERCIYFEGTGRRHPTVPSELTFFLSEGDLVLYVAQGMASTEESGLKRRL